jgi:D-alanyl-D-alanine carboxypeptidase
MEKIISKTVTFFVFIFFFCTSVIFSQQSVSDRLDEVTDSVLANSSLPGMIVSLTCGDFQWEKAKGFADVNGKVPMTLDKTFRAGSITKTFTVSVLLQLVDEGKLSLDDVISKYFSGIPNGDKITVRMLAGMTSGLPNYSISKEFGDSLNNNPHKKWQSDELLEMAFRNPVNFQPGTNYDYSNTNIIILGKLIEKLTRKTLADNTYERIIMPLGLKNTYIPESYQIPGDYSNGYAKNSDSVLIDVTETFDPSWGGAAGNIVSNLHDLKIYIRALAKGQLNSPRMQAERTTWNLFDMDNPIEKYGLGMFLFDDSYIGHDGGIPGFGNLAVYSPEKDCMVIVVFNEYTLYAGLRNPVPNFLAKRILDIAGK